jgi:hypothetical protein
MSDCFYIKFDDCTDFSSVIDSEYDGLLKAERSINFEYNCSISVEAITPYNVYPPKDGQSYCDFDNGLKIEFNGSIHIDRIKAITIDILERNNIKFQIFDDKWEAINLDKFPGTKCYVKVDNPEKHKMIVDYLESRSKCIENTENDYIIVYDRNIFEICAESKEKLLSHIKYIFSYYRASVVLWEKPKRVETIKDKVKSFVKGLFCR